MYGLWSRGSKTKRKTWSEVVKEDYKARKLNTEDAMDRSKWRKLIEDVRRSGWVWVGECFLCYRPTQVVPDQWLLNDCVCVLSLAWRAYIAVTFGLCFCYNSGTCIWMTCVSKGAPQMNVASKIWGNRPWDSVKWHRKMVKITCLSQQGLVQRFWPFLK